MVIHGFSKEPIEKIYLSNNSNFIYNFYNSRTISINTNIKDGNLYLQIRNSIKEICDIYKYNARKYDKECRTIYCFKYLLENYL